MHTDYSLLPVKMPLDLAALSIGIVLLLRVGPDIVLNIHHTNVVTAIADTVVGGESIFSIMSRSCRRFQGN
jgi:hypothetical protein